MLDRYYAYRICGPSRSSLQSGRLAPHVAATNAPTTTANPLDPVSGYAGIPRNMTGFAEKLRAVGYRTAFTGFDVGFASAASFLFLIVVLVVVNAFVLFGRFRSTWEFQGR